MICIQLFCLLHKQVLTQGVKLQGRQQQADTITAEITAGSTGLLCSRKGRVWTCVSYSAVLAIAAEEICFVHKAEQVSSVAWDL